MMTRAAFFKSVFAAFGMARSQEPICVGVVDGKQMEIECPTGCKTGEERCPRGHCQKPTHMMLEEHFGEEVIVHLISVCSTCRILYKT